MNRIFSTRWFLSLLVFTFIFTSNVVLAQSLPSQITYDIVYVKAPRKGDDTFVNIPEVFDPIKVEAGSDLVLLHPDGSEEILVAGGQGAILDPAVSFDGKWIYYLNANGKKFIEGTYKDDKPDGKWIFWDRGGRKIEELNYKFGDLVNKTIFKYTYFTGQLKSKKKYKDGECISGDC